nr:MAG TPA: hypothetical protein [Caudoviricetes sp.]
MVHNLHQLILSIFCLYKYPKRVYYNHSYPK